MDIEGLPWIERLVVANLIHPAGFTRQETKKMLIEHWNQLPADCRVVGQFEPYLSASRTISSIVHT